MLPGLETEVAGREIKFFVEQRVVGNVHLAVDAEQRTVGVNDGGGVVINAGGAFLEQRGDDDDLVFLREFAKGVGAGAGNFFGQLKIFVVFALAKILRAEQFLRADDLRACFGGAFDEREGFLEVRVRDWRSRRSGAAPILRLGRRRVSFFRGVFLEARGLLEHDGFAVRIFGRRGARDVLAEQFADEFAERLVGRAVAGVVNVILQIIHQLVRRGVTPGQVAREAVMQNVVELVVNARVQRAKIRDRLVQDALARFLGVLALENILAEQQVAPARRRRKTDRTACR